MPKVEKPKIEVPASITKKQVENIVSTERITGKPT